LLAALREQPALLDRVDRRFGIILLCSARPWRASSF
jgi:hypothetical protein